MPDIKKKRERNLTLNQVRKYNRAKRTMDDRCMKQFIRNAKTWLRKHPEAEGRILFDPENRFDIEYDQKHGNSYVGRAAAVSFDAKGKILFDFDSENLVKKGLYLSYDVSHGIYVEDWAWALQILLYHLENPYVPSEEDEE